MNNKKITTKLLPAMIALGMAAQAQAGITLYDQEGTTFSADGHLNAFYTYQDQGDQQVSRVRMGFLPNYIGFNVTKETETLRLGGRSSFWVTINDSNDLSSGNATKTDTGIDVRQFYGTVDGDFGQVLFGKDFGLYARSNIFSDELLMGVGFAPQGTAGTTFGNITTGYPYANPNAQITYRTPEVNGFKLAVGILDPNYDSGAGSRYSEDPRLEAELTYTTQFKGGHFNAWLGAAVGEATTAATDATVDAQGLAYGAQIGFGGFKLTVSGFDQEGIPTNFASNTANSDAESDGYLVQTSYTYQSLRGVLSHGNVDNNGTESELNAAGLFYKLNDNLQLVAEYSVYEADNTDDIDTIALGAVLTW